MAKHNAPYAPTAKGGKSNMSNFQPAGEARRRMGRKEKHHFDRNEQTRVGRSTFTGELSTFKLPIVGLLAVVGFFLVLYGALFYTLEKAKREGDAFKPNGA